MFLHAGIEPVYTIFASVKDAEAIVAANAEDDGWTFEIEPDPKGSGRAIVRVYDDLGNLCGNL